MKVQEVDDEEAFGPQRRANLMQQRSSSLKKEPELSKKVSPFNHMGAEVEPDENIGRKPRAMTDIFSLTPDQKPGTKQAKFEDESVDEEDEDE